MHERPHFPKMDQYDDDDGHDQTHDENSATGTEGKDDGIGWWYR